RNSLRFHSAVILTIAGIFFAGSFASPARAFAADIKVVWSGQEKPIVDQLRGLRKLPDDVRARTTKELALQIRQLPAAPNKLRLANGLAGLSTEGDFGHDTLQEVATTLAETLKERPLPWPEQKKDENSAGKSNPVADADKSVQAAQREPAGPYVELASLVRYEHVEASLDDDQYRAALSHL